jgi:twitching motility protein PilT
MENVEHIQWLRTLLVAVGQQGSSDLHLAVGRYPTLRIDGKLHPLTDQKILTPQDTKAFSDILMTEDKKQELVATGQTDLSYSLDERARFRTNIFIQKGYVGIIMRFVMDHLRSLPELGIPDTLYSFSNASQGLVLVTGPVGHGKSTTLAAILQYINENYDKHIVTIEDPTPRTFQMPCVPVSVKM